LALSFRQVAADLEAIGLPPVGAVSLVGGGARNELLCQFIADALGCGVAAGPAEATVSGNIGLQAVAAGAVANPEAIRGLMTRSFSLAHYLPREVGAWDGAYTRYREVMETR
jgi:rhamnulokinase